MTAFYIRTDQSVAGPFTGVELREACLAGILRYDAVIGGGEAGPWYKASDIGLFSEKRTPMPHPPGTEIPIYAVRGMPGPFHGPFKLRELIGFAARGLLPADALLQPENSEEWIPAKRFRILSACLSGKLVLIDHDGKVVVRSDVNSISAPSPTEQPSETLAARAPIEVARGVDTEDLNAERTHEQRWRVTDPEDRNNAASVAPVNDSPEIEARPSRLSLLSARLNLVGRFKGVGSRFVQPRLAATAACVLLAFAGVVYGVSYWQQMRMPREHVIGSWMSNDQPTIFGIEFLDDNRCVIFNAAGRSWTGDFEWASRVDDQQGFTNVAAFTSVIDSIDPNHEAGVVNPTDGYIRLRGFVKDPPQIAGHELRDFFVRREGEQLLIGYPAALHMTGESKSLEAGWIRAQPLNVQRPDVDSELSAIAEEFPIPTEEFGGEIPSHISKAMKLAKQGVATRVGNQEVTLHECMAYSNQIDAAYLLQRFGIPDEARSIYRFEIPKLVHGPDFQGAQIVVYGNWKFVLSKEGRLRYLVWLQNATSFAATSPN